MVRSNHDLSAPGLVPSLVLPLILFMGVHEYSLGLSSADLTSQKYGAVSMFGWSVLHITKQAAGVPRINRVTYMIHAGTDRYDPITTVDVDRTKALGVRGPLNPVDQLFDW